MTPRRRLALPVLLGLGALGASYWWGHRPLHPPPGVLAPGEPEQGPVERDTAWTFKGHRMVPLATYRLKARVLARERYRFDRGAALSPLDLALGWGPMSDSAVLDRIRVSQRDRWYFWSTGDFPIPRAEIERHSANVHLVPKDAYVASRLFALKVGTCATLQGLLLRVEGPGGWIWQSSLSREDTGDGSCELMWVESVQVQP